MQQLVEFQGAEAPQVAHIHMPERFGLAHQPGPGAGPLPAAQLPPFRQRWAGAFKQPGNGHPITVLFHQLVWALA